MFLFSDFIKWIKLVFEVKLSKKNFGIICPYGVGDTYFICALAKEFNLRNKEHSIVIIVKKHHLDVAKLFSDDFEKIVTVDMPSKKFFIILNFFLGRYFKLKPGHLMIGHPSFGKDIKMGVNNTTELLAYQKFFNLPQKAFLSAPSISIDAVRLARKRFKEFNFIEGKTVIIAPEANSFETLPTVFWQKLVNKFIKKGKIVCLNGDKYKIENAININFSLAEAIPMAELAGYVVSLRSGFCDLIYSAKCKLAVLYSNQNDSRTSFNIFSFKKMGISSSVYEYILEKNSSLGEIIDKIVSDLR